MDEPLTPEQQAAGDTLGRELLQQLDRVAVDMQADSNTESLIMNDGITG